MHEHIEAAKHYRNIVIFWLIWFTTAKNHVTNTVLYVFSAHRRGGKVTAKHMLNKQITLAISPDQNSQQNQKHLMF